MHGAARTPYKQQACMHRNSQTGKYPCIVRRMRMHMHMCMFVHICFLYVHMCADCELLLSAQQAQQASRGARPTLIIIMQDPTDSPKHVRNGVWLTRVVEQARLWPKAHWEVSRACHLCIATATASVATANGCRCGCSSGSSTCPVCVLILLRLWCECIGLHNVSQHGTTTSQQTGRYG